MLPVLTSVKIQSALGVQGIHPACLHRSHQKKRLSNHVWDGCSALEVFNTSEDLPIHMS
jgi:hypothetical protein